MPGETAPACPSCARRPTFGGLYLADRADDGARTCRVLWSCPDEHHWWHWADRPGSPLEPFPYASP